MKEIAVYKGLVWTGPGRTRFAVYGPYPSIEEGEKATARIQGNLRLIEQWVPDWFWELVKLSPNDSDLYKEGKKLGFIQ